MYKMHCFLYSCRSGHRLQSRPTIFCFRRSNDGPCISDSFSVLLEDYEGSGFVVRGTCWECTNTSLQQQAWLVNSWTGNETIAWRILCLAELQVENQAGPKDRGQPSTFIFSQYKSYLKRLITLTFAEVFRFNFMVFTRCQISLWNC